MSGPADDGAEVESTDPTTSPADAPEPVTDGSGGSGPASTNDGGSPTARGGSDSAGESPGPQSGGSSSSASAGAPSGSSGSLGAGGGAGQDAGAPAVPDTTPRPCNSSDGTGCVSGEVCVDVVSDTCLPTLEADCAGYCVATLPSAACEDGLAQCWGEVTCADPPGDCAVGFIESIVDGCWGPCVPLECCSCASNDECILGDASCDVTLGQCVLPAAPEPRCFLPFDPGPCKSAIPVFNFDGNECVEATWGGCDGNDNRFTTREECLRRCLGLPQQSECPDGRVPRVSCLECGGGGGCLRPTTVCAPTCETEEECPAGMTCADGVCATICF